MAQPLRSRAPAPPGGSRTGSPDALVEAPLGGTRAEALRRLQMGAVGVVAVLILIALASVLKDRAAETASTAVAEAAATIPPSTSPPAADPLAEAGVVPDIPAGTEAAVPTPSTSTAATSPAVAPTTPSAR